MKPTNRESIVVWGAGAIGGLLGVYLTKAGHDVVLVDSNAEHVKACNKNGLQVEGPIDEFTQKVTAVTPDDLQGSWYRIVLAVKAQHTDDAMQLLLPHLADEGYVLSAQNGLNEHLIASLIGRERTIGAFVNYGADWMAPGRILYGNRGAVVVGEIDGSIRARTQQLHELLCHFEPDAILTDNIWAYLWGKMGYGAMLFATALTHESMSENFSDPARIPVLVALAREVMSVASAEGVTPLGFNGYDPAAFHHTANDSDAAVSIQALAEFTAKTAKTHTGIYRDIAVRKRKTEVDPQIGAIVNIAEKHQLSVPFTTRLWQLMLDVENGRREQSADTFAELAKTSSGNS